MFSGKVAYEFLSKEYTWFWAALAFQAGYANAGGFLACASFVSHVTGFGTMVGISLSELDYVKAIEMLSVPVSFVIGSMLSALAIDRRMIVGKQPRYLWVMATMSVIFALITFGGISGAFGGFGVVEAPLLMSGNYLLLCLLSLACGMQNACFVSVSRGQIRTTHLTGILTDIGIVFVRLFFHRSTRSAIIEGRGNRIRLLTFVSFSAGSAISAILFRNLEYSAFGFLAVFSSVLWITMAIKQARLDASRGKSVTSVSASHCGDSDGYYPGSEHDQR